MKMMMTRIILVAKMMISKIKMNNSRSQSNKMMKMKVKLVLLRGRIIVRMK